MAAVFEQSRPDPDQGVFETLLVIDGRPVELEAHLARLEASLAELFPGREPPPLTEFDAPVSALGSLRITVAPSDDDELVARGEMRGTPPGAFAPPSGGKAPLARVSLHSLVLAGGLGAHKWADRSLLDEAQAGLPADAVPLILDQDGSVLEASRANVFAVRHGTLVTPPADGRILPGVTRMRVLEIAAAAGLETGEAELSRDDLLAADEVFLTGSVRGIERAGALDGTELSTRGRTGALIATELWRTWQSAKVG